MTIKGELFSTDMVRAFHKKCYVKHSESPNSRLHIRERILNMILINPDTGCWEWQGSLDHHGYGRITINHRSVLSHRASFYAFKGDIKGSLQVLHSCDNPKCVNPNHLHLGTAFDNMRECYDRGRHRKILNPMYGEKNPSAKLNRETAEKIRNLTLNSHLSQSKIAEMYSISQSVVSDIKRGVLWK